MMSGLRVEAHQFSALLHPRCLLGEGAQSILSNLRCREARLNYRGELSRACHADPYVSGETSVTNCLHALPHLRIQRCFRLEVGRDKVGLGQGRVGREGVRERERGGGERNLAGRQDREVFVTLRSDTFLLACRK